jgi:hypothetical protein
MNELTNNTGVRASSHLESQKNFRAMYVVISEEPLESNEWAYIDKEIYDFQLQGDDGNRNYNFWEATQGKGTITFDQVDKFLTSQAISSPLVEISGDSAFNTVETIDKDESSTNTATITADKAAADKIVADAAADKIVADTAEWPSPYNGVTPDSSYGLEFNNVGVLNSADATIYVCLRIFTDGLPSSVNGVGQFDMGLKVASLSEATVQITKFREFNAISALNEKGQTPDCSGIFETTTGVYTDIIQTDTSVLETTWNLIDPTNLILKLDSFKELTAN